METKIDTALRLSAGLDIERDDRMGAVGFTFKSKPNQMKWCDFNSLVIDELKLSVIFAGGAVDYEMSDVSEIMIRLCKSDQDKSNHDQKDAEVDL